MCHQPKINRQYGIVSLANGMRVTRMFIHPVKALKSIEVSEGRLGSYGFEYDRIYMLALAPHNESGKYTFYSQRRNPTLVLVEVKIEHDSIVLRYKDHEVRLPADSSGPFEGASTVSVEIFSKVVDCVDITGNFKIFDLFSALLGPDEARNLRLVAPLEKRTIRAEVPRELTDNAQPPTQFVFQDLYPVHMIASASFESLKTRVDSMADEEGALVVQNFRPNLVVETEEPWVEDDWRFIRIGPNKFYVAETRERCPVPTVDVETGTYRKSKEPYRSLGHFRVLTNGARPSFGIDLIHLCPGATVRVGDPVEILETNA